MTRNTRLLTVRRARRVHFLPLLRQATTSYQRQAADQVLAERSGAARQTTDRPHSDHKLAVYRGHRR